MRPKKKAEENIADNDALKIAAKVPQIYWLNNRITGTSERFISNGESWGLQFTEYDIANIKRSRMWKRP